MMEFRSLAWRLRLVSVRLVRSSQTATGRPTSNNTTSRRRNNPVLPPNSFCIVVSLSPSTQDFATNPFKSVNFLARALDPVFPFEPDERQQRGDHHDAQR